MFGFEFQGGLFQAPAWGFVALGQAMNILVQLPQQVLELLISRSGRFQLPMQALERLFKLLAIHDPSAVRRGLVDRY